MHMRALVASISVRRTAQLRHRDRSGFTLLELLFTLIVLGVLAAIAMPSFSEVTVRGKLREAPIAFSEILANMQKFYLVNKSFRAAAGACGVAMPTSPRVSYFTYRCAAAPDGMSFTVTATSTASVGAAPGAGAYVYTLSWDGNRQSKSTLVFAGTAVTDKPCWMLYATSGC